MLENPGLAMFPPGAKMAGRHCLADGRKIFEIRGSVKARFACRRAASVQAYCGVHTILTHQSHGEGRTQRQLFSHCRRVAGKKPCAWAAERVCAGVRRSRVR
jgi:hypothetical protein